MIRTSVVLTQDLTCAVTIEIAGSGVRINLGGHTLSAVDVEAENPLLDVTGDRVVISNGHLTGASTALRAVGADLRLRVVSFHANAVGAYVRGPRASIERSNFVDNRQAIVAEGGAVHIDRSQFTGNGDGVSVLAGPVRVSRSDFSHDGNALHLFGGPVTVSSTSISHAGTGLYVEDESNSQVPYGQDTATIVNSKLRYNRTAVYNDEAGQVSILRSTLQANTEGISCRQARVDVAGSTVLDNAVGITMGQCEGSVFSSTLFHANDASIRLSDFEPQFDDGTVFLRNNKFTANGGPVELREITAPTITGNIFADNAAGLSISGLNVVASGPTGGIVNRNRFISNDRFGLQMRDSSAVVGQNQAIGNGGPGMDVPGVTDGGGNVARKNAGPQCVGVTCTLR